MIPQATDHSVSTVPRDYAGWGTDSGQPWEDLTISTSVAVDNRGRAQQLDRSKQITPSQSRRDARAT